jgi:hypothetical protein
MFRPLTFHETMSMLLLLLLIKGAEELIGSVEAILGA